MGDTTIEALGIDTFLKIIKTAYQYLEFSNPRIQLKTPIYFLNFRQLHDYREFQRQSHQIYGIFL